MKNQLSLRKKIFFIIDDHKSKKTLNKLFHGLLFFLIVLSSINLILESVDSIQSVYSGYLIYIEIFTVFFFSIEYFLRIYTCVEMPKYKNSYFLGRIRYLLTPLMIIDLLSLLPMYFFMFTANYSNFYIFGAFRILRLFKAVRYLNAFKLIGQVFIIKKDQLLIAFTFIFFAFIVFSCFIYVAEFRKQPEIFSSIPKSMWYAISTITTVGYGDMVAITPLGKIISGIMSISGWLLFAIPTSILTSGFLKTYLNDQKQSCPHCGKMHD